MIKKKCDSCGRINRNIYTEFTNNDSCDYCCKPLFNEYGKYFVNDATCEKEGKK